MHKLEFYSLIDRTYTAFPPAQDRESIGIDLSNAAYIPELGQRVFEEVTQSAQRAERLGYDGALLFEQHSMPLALFPNALTGAAWLAAKTSKIKIAAVGPILNAYSSPVRVAEEIALVDALSGGRLTVGFPLGVGAQYHGVGAMNPVHARAKFRESVELLHRIFTDDGPFAWEGEYYHHPYVNVWPRPTQKPHPDIFLPGAGSRETIELAAKLGFTYQAFLVPLPVLKKNIQLFRDLSEEYGTSPDPRRVTMVLQVHVAETDAEARAEIEKHALWGVQNIVRFPFHESFPPGHVSPQSLRGMMSGGYRSSDPSLATFDQLTSNGYIVGSPESVVQQIADITGEVGAGRIIVGSDFTLPMWLQEKTMTLFAEQVMPAFRDAGALASWQIEKPTAYETIAELSGRNIEPAGRPVVRKDGEYIPLFDTKTGL